MKENSSDQKLVKKITNPIIAQKIPKKFHIPLTIYKIHQKFVENLKMIENLQEQSEMIEKLEIENQKLLSKIDQILDKNAPKRLKKPILKIKNETTLKDLFHTEKNVNLNDYHSNHSFFVNDYHSNHSFFVNDQKIPLIDTFKTTSFLVKRFTEPISCIFYCHKLLFVCFKDDMEPLDLFNFYSSKSFCKILNENFEIFDIIDFENGPIVQIYVEYDDSGFYTVFALFKSGELCSFEYLIEKNFESQKFDSKNFDSKNTDSKNFESQKFESQKFKLKNINQKTFNLKILSENVKVIKFDKFKDKLIYTDGYQIYSLDNYQNYSLYKNQVYSLAKNLLISKRFKYPIIDISIAFHNQIYYYFILNRNGRLLYFDSNLTDLVDLKAAYSIEKILYNNDHNVLYYFDAFSGHHTKLYIFEDEISVRKRAYVYVLASQNGVISVHRDTGSHDKSINLCQILQNNCSTKLLLESEFVSEKSFIPGVIYEDDCIFIGCENGCVIKLYVE